MHNLSVVITACLIIARHGNLSCRHGACARVCPCNADKSERSSSGPRRPRKRHLTRPSLPSPLSQSNQWPAGNHNGNLCFSRVGSQEPPEVNNRRCRELSFSLAHVIRLRVKRGAPEHRDSGALTGSPSLTPGLTHGIATRHTSGG